MNEQQEKTSELNTCSDCKYREKLFHEHPFLNCTNALGIYENYEKEDLPDFGKMKAKFNEMCLKQGVNVLTIEKDYKDLEERFEKLNKLLTEIWQNLFYHPAMYDKAILNIKNLISDYFKSPLIGQTRFVEIDGKQYEVTINKEV